MCKTNVSNRFLKYEYQFFLTCRNYRQVGFVGLGKIKKLIRGRLICYTLMHIAIYNWPICADTKLCTLRGFNSVTNRINYIKITNLKRWFLRFICNGAMWCGMSDIPTYQFFEKFAFLKNVFYLLGIVLFEGCC